MFFVAYDDGGGFYEGERSPAAPQPRNPAAASPPPARPVLRG